MADDDCGSISENSSTDRTMASANQTLSTSTASKTNVHTRTATKKKKSCTKLKIYFILFFKKIADGPICIRNQGQESGSGHLHPSARL